MGDKAGVLLERELKVPSSRRASWSSPLFLAGRAALGVALLIYVLRSGRAWESLQDVLATPWLVVVLNAMPIAGASVEASRLQVLFAAQGVRVSFASAFRAVAIGTLFNLWIPGGTGGDVMKVYYLSAENPGRVVQTATILFVDRVVALWALLVLISALLVALPTVLPVVSDTLRRITLLVPLALVGLMAGSFGMWCLTRKSSGTYRWAAQSRHFGRYFGQAADAVYAFRHARMALLKAAAFSLVGHVMLAMVFSLAGTVLVPGASGLVVATLSLIGLVANVIPLTPGGIGVGEAASEALFRSAGIQGGAALIAVWRGGMFALCLIGAVLYVFGERLTSPGRHDGASGQGH
jgi:uncharacterized protein (TIRG00374 family)